MNVGQILASALLGAGVVVLLIPFIVHFAKGRPFHSRVEFHHTHVTPVPRLGGVALAAAFVVVELALAAAYPSRRAAVTGGTTLILTSLAMFGVGFCDDVRPLGAGRKLIAQVLIASYAHFGGLGIELLKIPFTHEIVPLHGWGLLFTILWLVGLTNLLNLIDGVDGLAGGVGLMLMALLLYVAHQNGSLILLTAGVAGALIAFLLFNLPPARIYLGDGGAYFLGYQIGVFSLVGSQKGSVLAALIAPLFVLALPIVDMSLAILRRGLRGLPLMRPDRRHIHHRLLAGGMSRRRVVITVYAITSVFLAMGFAAFCSEGRLVPALLGVAVLVLLVCAGRLSFAREWFAVGHTLGNSLAMRSEIQYALSLMSCLRHEAERCRTREQLFSELASTARHLGFCSVKWTGAEGECAWHSKPACVQTRRHRQELPGAASGVLELTAPNSFRPHSCEAGDCILHSRPLGCRSGNDPRLFEIMAELLGENWTRAAARCAARFSKASVLHTPAADLSPRMSRLDCSFNNYAMDKAFAVIDKKKQD